MSKFEKVIVALLALLLAVGVAIVVIGLTGDQEPQAVTVDVSVTEVPASTEAPVVTDAPAPAEKTDASVVHDEGNQPRLTTVSFTPADYSAFMSDEESTAVSDLLKAMSVTVYEGEDGGSFALLLDGTQVLTLDFAADEAGTIYLGSNFLGDKPVAVAVDEWEPLMDKVLALLVASGEMTQEEADALRLQLASSFSEATAADNPAEAFADADTSALVALMTEIAESSQTTAVTEQPEGCDKAVSKTVFTITPEQMARFYPAVEEALRSSEGGQAFLAGYLSSFDMTYEDLTAWMNSDGASAAARIKEDVVITAYTSVTGLVSMDFSLVMDYSDQGFELPVDFSYKRQTKDNGVNHHFVMNSDVDARNVMNIAVTYVEAEGDDTIIGLASMTLDGESTMTMSLDGVIGERKVEGKLNMVMAEGGEEERVTFALEGEETDAGFTAVIVMDMDVEDDPVNLRFDVKVETLSAEGRETTTAAFVLEATASGETVSLGFELSDDRSDADADGLGSLFMTASGVKLSLDCDYATVVAGGADKTDAEVSVSAMGMKIPLATVHVTVEECEARPSIITADALRPAQMSDAELEKWGKNVAAFAQVGLMKLAQKLPASVLKLMR